MLLRGLSLIACLIPGFAACSKGEPREVMSPDLSSYMFRHPEKIATAVPELYQRADELLRRRDVVGAREVYQQAITAEPKNSLGYVGLAACAMQEKDFAAARGYYETAEALDGRSAAPQIGLGSVAYAQARYVDAADAFERAVSREPDDPDAHWGAAIAYEAQRKMDPARQHAKRFLALAPNSNLAEMAREIIGR